MTVLIENKGLVTEERLKLYMNALKYKDIKGVYIYKEGGMWKIQSEYVNSYNKKINAQDYDWIEQELGDLSKVVNKLYLEYRN